MSIGTIKPEGSLWCATMYDFRNLQLDNAGFGETPEQAVDDLNRELRFHPFHARQKDYPYSFYRFEVQP